MPQGPLPWHLQEAHELLSLHGVDPARGLNDQQVQALAVRYGLNQLPAGRKRGVGALVWEQLSNFMILVLVAAAVLAGMMGDVTDTLVILAIVIMNAGIGVVQSWRADRALDALRKMSAIQAKVLRGGEARLINAKDLVPGDIVILEAGNQVPADLRLMEIAQLRVDESALTGESAAIEKITGALPAASSTVLADRLNMAFKGTTVAHGRGRGLVMATGLNTELGKVAGMIQQDVEVITPLQQRLSVFGKRVALVVMALCGVIFTVGVLRGEAPVTMLLLAVGLAVAAIPEALPAVVTVLLALGARRLVGFKALVRRLTAVETLGSVTYICSDKTGTLTQNRMQAEQWVVMEDGTFASWTSCSTDLSVTHKELLRAATLCNDATQSAQGDWQGDPTETALTACAAQAGHEKADLEAEYPRVSEQPFDSDRKRMTTFHRSPQGYVAYTKGAPEAVVPRCKAVWQATDGAALVSIDGEAWLGKANAMAAEGLRVLAVARRSYEHLPEAGGEIEAVESGLCLIGLIGLMDPPRTEAVSAVQECMDAGITPVMITGDHPATARAVAMRIGIVRQAQASVLTGSDLAQMSDDELKNLVRQVRIYARVDPAQKIRIVQALQDLGEFVAMTGDGINDAPALRRANIGVAMGLGGTDVAREASSLVLLDDNFATIVRAVREGRHLYDNIRKFVRYAMTGNSGEIWTILLAPMLLMPTPLLPIHILWVNLVTDGLPGLALAAEPAEPGIMSRPPRPPSENLFAHGMWQHILGVGLLIGALCLGVQAWALTNGNAHGQTMVFTVLTLSQLAHLLAIRSETSSLWQLGLWTNKPLLGAVALSFGLQMATVYVQPLNSLFKTQPLTRAELGICMASACVVWVAVEIEKLWRRRRR